MRILPRGPREDLLRRAMKALWSVLKPPRTELEFMESVVVAEREGRPASAARWCERGLRRFPGDYYLLMKRLSQLRETGAAGPAEGLLERAAACCPRTAATLSSVGEEYAFLGKMEEAEAWIRRALERTPSNPLLREKLAMAIVQQRRMEEGIAELSTAVEQEPANTARRDLLFQVLLAAERFEELVSLLEKIPQESMTWEALTFLSIARARLDGGDAFADAMLHPGQPERARAEESSETGESWTR